MNLARRGFLKTTSAVVAGSAASNGCVDAAVHEPRLNSATKPELAHRTVALAKKLGETYGDGAWRVENRMVKHPVRNFRFNQSVMQMLAPGNVEMTGKPVRVGGWFPALKLKAFTFSSESQAV